MIFLFCFEVIFLSKDTFICDIIFIYEVFSREALVKSAYTQKLGVELPPEVYQPATNGEQIADPKILEQNILKITESI